MPATLRETLLLVSNRLAELMDVLGRAVGRKMDVFDYNCLYLEALKREPRFKKYVYLQSEKFSKCVDLALSSGEIKPLPPEFIKRVLLDIFGRGSDVLGKKGRRRNLENIIFDMRQFYELIKA